MKLNFKVLGTGSSGNCYLFYNDYVSFIIDAGVAVRKVLEHPECLNNIFGVFITHEHYDHSSHAEKLSAIGVDIYCTFGTGKSIGASRYNIIEYMKPVKISEHVKVTPIPITHNANEPCGFIIDHYGERTLFATDCNDIGVNVSMVKNFIIEANHCLSLMEKTDINFMAYQNHMSVNSAISYINENKGLQTDNCYLIHLSQRNAKPKEFRKRVQENTSIETILPTIKKQYSL